MSAVRRSGGRADRNTAARASAAPPEKPTARPPDRLSALLAMAPPRIDALQRALPRRHPLPACERFLGGALDLPGHLRLDLFEPLRRDASLLQVLLVQPDRVALPPPLEQLGGERLPGLPFIVGRVAAHPERLGNEHRGPFPLATARGRELRRRVRVEHVVAVELGAPDAVARRPILEVAGQVMLLEPRAERDLVVLDDENRGDLLDRCEVRPLVRGGGLRGPIAHPGEGDPRSE